MGTEEMRTVNTVAAEELYLDHNATTPMRAEAVEAMLPWLGQPANPSSAHSVGERASRAVETAREQIATLIGARRGEIVFTSGATEANNLALRNAIADTLVVSAIEHPSVLRTAEALAATGRGLLIIGPNEHGEVPTATVISTGPEERVLVSVMLANNETGVVNEVAGLARANPGSVVHTDATQAAGRVRIDVDDLGVDLMSLSAHKFGGPQGVGVLYVRRGTKLAAHAQTGGGQERDRRSGTLNVAGIVAAGAAAEAATKALEAEAAHVRDLRDRFEQLVLDSGLEAVVIGAGAGRRLPNTSLFAIPGATADAMISNASHIVMSHGSACSAGALGPSHVLSAMNVPDAIAECALRVTFGLTNTRGDADTAASAVIAAATRVLQLAHNNLGGAA